MGRTKSKFWKYFDKIVHPQDPNKPSTSKCSCTVICKYCSTKYEFANAFRMKKHLADCIQCPATVKKEAQVALKEGHTDKGKKRKELESDEDDIFMTSSSETLQISPSPGSSQSSTVTSTQQLSKMHRTKPTSSQSTMDKYSSTTSDVLKIKIDEALTRALIMSNCPLNLFENEYWQLAINLMRPSYAPPSRFLVSNRLLDSEYECVMQGAQSKIKSSPVLGVLSDGWTGPTGENLINFVISTPEPVFLKTVAPGLHRETADFVGEEIIKIIDEFVKKGQNTKKFFTIITDNAANMKAMWAIVRAKYSHIVVIGCSAHMLNLLLTDIMKQESFLAIRRIVKMIVQAIRRHHVVLAFFKSAQKKRYGNKSVTLKFPPKTRWFYLVISLCSLKRNKSALQATVIEESLEINKEVRRNVLDNEGFWNYVEEFYNMLLPIALAIGKVESDATVLSQVPRMARKIEKSVLPLVDSSLVLNEEEKSTCKEAVIRRLYYCYSEVHCAANLLDPKIRGKDLQVVEKQTAMTFIGEQCKHLDLNKGLVMANLAEFRTKTNFFGDENMWEATNYTSPLTWWAGFCPEQPLFPIAQRLFSVPVSSAACERNWSFHGAVHTKPRNRLLKKRIEKLVAIRCNMRFSPNYLPKKKTKAKKTILDKDGVEEDWGESDIELDKDIDIEFDIDSDYSFSESDDSELEDSVPIDLFYPSDVSFNVQDDLTLEYEQNV